MSYTKPEPTIPPKGKLCDYGCNNLAKYYFKRPKKWCCKENVGGCPQRKKDLEERRKFRKELNKKYPIKNLEFCKEAYPLTYELEELRDDPNPPTKGVDSIIQARCTYNECPHSVSNNGWFNIPLFRIGLREWGIRHEMDGYRWYCSRECELKCPAFGKTASKMIKDYNLLGKDLDNEWEGGNANDEDKRLFRTTCLLRDKKLCQVCFAEATHVHHINPVKTHPHMQLDPDNGISVCTFCHYHIFHAKGTDCSTGNLANKLCYPIINGEKKIIREGADKKKSAPSNILTFDW